jgi:ketosteroid isomerase-like protein
MSQDNVSIITTLYAEFAAGNAPAVLAAFDAAIEWNEAENFLYADGNPYIGPAAVAEGVFGRIGEEWEGFSVDVEQIVGCGDVVLAMGRYRGTYVATVETLDAQFAHVWWVRDGKVVRFQQYTDTAQAAAVAGGTRAL